jgi:hypothetical protein
MNQIQTDTHSMTFVFGSNLGGYHGAGAALYARRVRGAEIGIGIGPTGSCYAIPTKTKDVKETLPLHEIDQYVQDFLRYAARNLFERFQVTCIGCGLAGLEHEQVAPMFVRAPRNCYFDTLWHPWLPEGLKYWGTYDG